MPKNRLYGICIVILLCCVPSRAGEMKSYTVRIEPQLYLGNGFGGAEMRLIFEKIPFVSPYAGAELFCTLWYGYLLGNAGIQKRIPVCENISVIPILGYTFGSNLAYFSCHEGMHGALQIALGEKRVRLHISGELQYFWYPEGWSGYAITQLGGGISIGI